MTNAPKPPSSSPPSPPSGFMAKNLKRRRKYRLRRRQYASAPLAQLLQDDGGAVALGELEQARAEKAKLEEEFKAEQERGLRVRADMENLRRRHQKEKEEMRKFAGEEVMRSMVPALDHFGLAIQSLATATDVDSVRQGIGMIHRELLGILSSGGLQEIAAPNVPFDPNLHEAVATEPSADKADGTVLEVMRSGWSLNGRIMRPAMVKVVKNDTSPPTPPRGETIVPVVDLEKPV